MILLWFRVAAAQMCSCEVCPGVGSPTFGPAIPQTVYGGAGNDGGLADLDGDGDVDLYTVMHQEGIAWYENLGGLSFALHLVSVLPLQGGFYTVAHGDLDGDGDFDLVSQAYDRDEVIWHENLLGASFGPVQVVATAPDVIGVRAADLDGDGLADVITSTVAGEIAWYRSDGSGAFAPPQILIDVEGAYGGILFTLPWEPVANVLDVGDLDADGDLDLVVIGTDEVWVLRNAGDGTFCETRLTAVECPFTCNDRQWVFLADADADGDLDVHSMGESRSSYWFENDGTGSFPRQHYGGNLFPGDLDADGDADGVHYVQNFGGYYVSPPSWPAGNGVLDGFRAADLDGDGDADILNVETYDGTVAVYENLMDCLSPDTDGDGLTDADEASSSYCPGCDPTLPDTDGDGLSDLDEIREETNPTNPDTDGDGLLDGAEGCPALATTSDVDGDGVCGEGNCGVYDCNDVCPFVYDPDQGDLDHDGIGDACDLVTFVETSCSDAYWPDGDGDGYGDAGALPVSVPTVGHVADGGDCDDVDPAVHPGADEIPCNEVDDDCDAGTPDGVAGDVDGDGVDGCEDCADWDAGRSPLAVEIADGVDQDCDLVVDEGTSWYDDDGDGFSEVGGDCDDAAAARSPAAVEACDGADEDCDGAVDEGTSCADDDGDGFAEDAGDCDDAEPAVYPGAPEDPANGRDDDCDGELDGWVDEDLDGFASAVECDDADAAVHPGAVELPDGVDQDCDGVVDEGTVLADDDGDGVSEAEGDCHDGDAAIHPDAAELADGRDQDCDGVADEGTTATDDDGDGRSEAGGDCDDTDPDVHPWAEERPNGADDDCDEEVDEGLADPDGDGYADGDCDPAAGYSYPSAPELCDGEDNDCDGVVDDGACHDPAAAAAGPPEGCGCRTGGTSSAWLLLVAALRGCRRRHRPPTGDEPASASIPSA